MINHVLAQNLRKYREASGLSQVRLAALSGINRKSIINMEKATGNPSLYTLEDIAKCLDVSIIDLLTEGGTS